MNRIARTFGCLAFAIAALGLSACGPGNSSGGASSSDAALGPAGAGGESGDGGSQVQIPNGEATIGVHDTQLYVRVVGQGEPLLIVHGGPGLDQSYLQPGMNGLADRFTLIYFDQRASGKSTAPLRPDQVSLDLFLSDIDQVREHFGMERVNLLGHSFGGVLAMRYAMDYPSRVERLVLSNSIPASSELRQQEAAASQARLTEAEKEEQKRILASDAFRQRRSEGFEEYFRFIFEREFADRSKLDQLVLDLPESFAANGALLGSLAADLSVYDWFEELRKIEAPTLVVYGSHEASQASQTRLAGAIPNVELVVLEECGHFPYIEQPEAYFEAIRSFLQGE